MIYLNQFGNTLLKLSNLYDRCQNQVNPYFTWVIKEKQSQLSATFSAMDFSQVPMYWNTFTVSVSPTFSSGTNSIIQALPGQYDYTVYEMANPYDLNINNAVGVVNYGIIVMAATYSPITTYTQSSVTTNIVYQNQNRS
jgi:hypothetical protein